MRPALRIVGWSRYMHADCKRSASMPWVKCPTSHAGLGYLELMDHPDGMAHFGAWVLIMQVAAQTPQSNGVLITDSGRTLGAREIALKTKGNTDFFEEAIKRLLAIGWLEMVDLDDSCKQVASNMQATCKQHASLEERRGEETRGDCESVRARTHEAPEGGMVEVNPEALDLEPSPVVRQTPAPTIKPTVSLMDWKAHGHGKIVITSTNRDEWQAMWRRWKDTEGWTDAWEIAYKRLIDVPKIWPDRFAVILDELSKHIEE